MRGHPGRIDRWPPVEILSVSSVRGVADLTSITDAARAAFFRPRTCGHDGRLRVFGLLADDVDYAIYCISSPQCSARAPDHFDPIDILEHHILNIPVHTGKQRRIHTSTVDEDQQLVVEPPIKSARSDGPLVLVDARHFKPGHKSQRVGNARGPRTPNILLRNHKYSGRGIRHLL